MNKIKIVFGYTILIFSAILMIAPFIWILSISFMDNTELFSKSVNFLPNKLNLSNYIEVLKSINICQYFLNSLLVSIITTIGQLIIVVPAGYAFAKLTFKYKDILFFLIILTMMVPPQVNIVPLFFIMRELHLINTYSALILPGIVGGFGIFLMRQAFKTVPKELEYAAKIDGCSVYKIFYKIALPQVTPYIATLSIFTFITSWNSFMWPLIVTNSDALRTLPVGLAIFKSSFRETTEWTQLMACAVISTIPVIIVFLMGKKYFVNDILSGSIKE